MKSNKISSSAGIEADVNLFQSLLALLADELVSWIDQGQIIFYFWIFRAPYYRYLATKTLLE